MECEGRTGANGVRRSPWTIGLWRNEGRAENARAMEGIALVLGGSVAVLSVVGAALVVIARLTGGAGEE